jgi:hypothetical protein
MHNLCHASSFGKKKIEGLHKKLCALKVAGIVVVGISGVPLGSPETKSHLDVAPWRVAEYIIWGRWWLPPSPGRGESCESRIARGLS